MRQTSGIATSSMSHPWIFPHTRRNWSLAVNPPRGTSPSRTASSSVISLKYSLEMDVTLIGIVYHPCFVFGDVPAASNLGRFVAAYLLPTLYGHFSVLTSRRVTVFFPSRMALRSWV